ncbi:MAG: LysR family transcriptional regulator [bacterium]|nr:LysR family transcriptional regulator [Myxococcales bacterium]MCB9542863.1 LysR family transcriptional regulator [Myxococcales bacterium]MCB9553703.1 LysR family transcriptional regulator [Myxococcales bacterium]
MDWLNYHHLLYFWTAARDGGVTAAARALRLAPSTLSAQIRQLEERLGHALFRRDGRRLVLTEVGETVYSYADEIFALGRELTQTLDDRPHPHTARLVIGVADVMPRLLAARLVRPVLGGDVRLACRTGDPRRLIEEMALHRVHVVLSDAPAPADATERLVSHLVGACPIELFAAPALAARHRDPLPEALDGAPFLLPAEHTELRRALDEWFVAHRIRPRIMGEFDDSALMKAFGQQALGLFPAPALVAPELIADHGVVCLHRLDGPQERVYAHVLERRTAHPLIEALITGARAVFAPPAP